jgi:hypothetical protein
MKPARCARAARPSSQGSHGSCSGVPRASGSSRVFLAASESASGSLRTGHGPPVDIANDPRPGNFRNGPPFGGGN